MKRVLGILLICLFSSMTAASPLEQGNNEINISSSLKIALQSLREENKNLKYTIDLKYPQLSGQDKDMLTTSFNQDIRNFIGAETTEFKNKVVDTADAARDLPLSVQQNLFYIVYSANAFKTNHAIVVSARFNKEYSYAGSAHPTHNIEVYNYDLNTGKRLRLEDLFSPDSGYLQIFSDYCRYMLSQKLKDSDSQWIASGTVDKPENFVNWNLRPDGILITFDEYQVAPYVDGQPQVLVPYSVLQNVISPDAVIAVCAKNSAICSPLA